MKDIPNPRGSNKTPMERLADLTRRIVAVPKTELPTKRKPKAERHGK